MSVLCCNIKVRNLQVRISNETAKFKYQCTPQRQEPLPVEVGLVTFCNCANGLSHSNFKIAHVHRMAQVNMSQTDCASRQIHARLRVHPGGRAGCVTYPLLHTALSRSGLAAWYGSTDVRLKPLKNAVHLLSRLSVHARISPSRSNVESGFRRLGAHGRDLLTSRGMLLRADWIDWSCATSDAGVR